MISEFLSEQFFNIFISVAFVVSQCVTIVPHHWRLWTKLLQSHFNDSLRKRGEAAIKNLSHETRQSRRHIFAIVCNLNVGLLSSRLVAHFHNTDGGDKIIAQKKVRRARALVILFNSHQAEQKRHCWELLVQTLLCINCCHSVNVANGTEARLWTLATLLHNSMNARTAISVCL